MTTFLTDSTAKTVEKTTLWRVSAAQKKRHSEIYGVNETNSVNFTRRFSVKIGDAPKKRVSCKVGGIHF